MQPSYADSYVIFDNVFWRALAPQINRWRKNTLGLHSTDLDKMAQQKVRFRFSVKNYPGKS